MRTSASPPSGTAAERAYEFAKWAILTSVYGPDDVITETGLARETGAGRTPVRHALLRLQVEGLVRLRPRRGAVVSSFTVQDAEDVLEARMLIENFTARRSFARRADLLPALEETHEEMRRRHREHDTAGFTGADRTFHELIVDAAGNRVLSGVYRSLRERQTLFTSVIVRGRADRMDAAVAEHDRIIATLRGDDEAAFCDAVHAHLEWSIAQARQARST